MTIHHWDNALWAGVIALALPFASLQAMTGPLPVSIKPAHLEFAVHPGEEKSGSFAFTNGSSSDLPIHVEADDFQSTDENGNVAIGASESAANSLLGWVKPAISDMVVPAGKTVDLAFVMDVPATAQPGGHWGALMAVTAPQAQPQGPAVNVHTGPIILVNVLGSTTVQVPEKVTVESFSASLHGSGSAGEFAVRFKNEGQAYETPHGQIEIRNIFGHVVATGALTDVHVLPGAIRKVTASIGGGLWFVWSAAHLAATYADGKSVEADTSFWVMPWKGFAFW